ncbi:MAG: mechanosensitive ion channel family protein [Alphaproteobacteria bacterium]|nr:mechanosensitive ion channel family protein [Alphaproteobacteria bacterium]MBU1516641.1 mechanosensitive ion channel family protein [Alphaproteobacteria bacterium]MBU2094397.1 mechanosensitive ion channel family protein [Alphaproteobacteria bacterium]MBU2153282.1 mechanosensitive ion channel family protein [Alphaproteobacteria bacterium]MBU2307568.1 mechanosensitive ion channel family protein [Alphaproteobacteria bacterium]
MTTSQSLYDGIRNLASGLSAIGPIDLGVNAAATGLVVLVGWGLAVGLRRVVRLGVRRLPGRATADKQVRGSRALRFSSALFNLLIALAVLMGACAIWGFDVAAWLSSGMGRELSQTVLRAGLVVVVAALALEAAGYLIHEAVERLVERSEDPRRAAQLNTFGPLLRGAAQGTIAIVAALMLLGDLGVRIGPLLAGAGVVGIAVGFGAQTVVRDLLTGMFLLVEDIVAVGDIARIGDSGGLVEAMTLRTIRLRDFDGTLHVVPYGEAQVVHNLTKTFSYYVFDLQVPYETDVDRALEVMSEVGAEMQDDPAYADRILEPIEVVGVDGLGDTGVRLKARVKTRPIQQWSIGREYNRRIKSAFEQAGINIALPHLKVVLPQAQARALERGMAPSR